MRDSTVTNVGRALPGPALDGFVSRVPCGLLSLAGGDRLDFLHRLTTNDFREVAPPEGLPAVLATPAGRFMALLFAHLQPDSVLLRVEAEQTDALMRYFGSMIFWRDDVQVTDLSPDCEAVELHGVEWAHRLPALGFRDATTMPAYSSLAGQIAGNPVMLCKGGSLDLADWILIVHRAPEEIEEMIAGMAPRIAGDDLKRLRIERGLPAWGHELNDSVTPLEANLLPTISFDKGCYVGQEVIARQVNYDKITRRLVGLVFEPGAPADVEGARVEAPGRDINVTSSVFAPHYGTTIALAIVPRGLAESGATVTVIHHEQPYEARVTSLPFA